MGAAITQITVTIEPMATSIYATDDMPAIAVVTITNAAMMYVPCSGVTASGKIRCSTSPPPLNW